MLHVHAGVVPMVQAGIILFRSPGHLGIVTAEGMNRDAATRLARSLLSAEERDAVRAAFGVPPIEAAPGLDAWAHLPETIGPEVRNYLVEYAPLTSG